MTTDQSGCTHGSVRDNKIGRNYFDNRINNTHLANPSCNYTATFNGTSSAAPVTSGSIALILEANSNLNWRDVKHILAKTAIQVDPNINDTTVILSDGNYIAEPQWLTNNANYKFHNYYGFGRIDVAKAVAMAETYAANSLGVFVITAWQDSGSLTTKIANNR